MVIIADCGATKCDWLIVHGERNHQLENTSGFSPYLHTTEEIKSIVVTQLAPKLDPSKVTNIWFYGTGVHDAHRSSIVEVALKSIFSNAKIEVEHDLLASARAACGHNAGIACILGTGSNSCYYDGAHIVDNVESLGWLLGDEGSGSHLGKALLRAWFYRELPLDLDKSFRATYPEGGDAIKDKIYEKGANAYIASFTTFLTEHIKHPYIQKLVAASLGEFLDRTVCKYPGHQSVPINFVGSIAHHFEDILKKCMKERALEMGIIIRKPIYPLAEYHVKQND
jgi:glucosamine kinase